MRVIHFELCADNPERAARFYEAVFGWKTDRWAGPIDYWLVSTGTDDQPGINGAIMRRPEPTMSTANTIAVPSVDRILEEVVSRGGSVLRPKTTIPGVGYFAYCRDTEGNAFGVMEEDAAAG